MGVRALSDPEARRILDAAYRDGWPHDFYLVTDDGECLRGPRTLPRLTRALGVRRTAAALGEYAAFRAGPRRCGAASHAAETGSQNGHGPSRRNVLKYAALTPVAAGLSRLPGLRDPFATPAADAVRARVAVVVPDGAGGHRVAVATPKLRPAFDVRPARHTHRGADALRRTTLDDTVLVHTTVPTSPTESATLQVWRTVTETTGTRAGAAVQEHKRVHAASLDHSRYNVGGNVAHAPVTTRTGRRPVVSMATMVTYDVAAPSLDVVRYRPAVGDDVSSHLGAYAAALRELAAVHRAEGATDTARVYAEIEAGLDVLRVRFADVVSDGLTPVVNTLVVTPMPETMRAFGSLDLLFEDVWVPFPDDVPELPTDDLGISAGDVCICGCIRGCCSNCCGCGTRTPCGRGCGCCRSACNTCGCGCCDQCG